MTEEFLHHIWQFQLFDFGDLQTGTGENLEIIKPGEKNTHAGPDFFNARIRIADTVWAGNVEIHTNASEWKKHNHHTDKAYDNVILHVVLNNDKDVISGAGKKIPTLELSGRINDDLHKKYNSLIKNNNWIPCQKAIQQVDQFTVNNWLDRLIAERLERKSAAILSTLEATGNDWSETFYIHLANNFGFKVNNLPFEQLAKSVSLKR